MLNEATISSIDQHNLYRLYKKWPEHFREASKLKIAPVQGIDSYESIAFCGMGGSATAGDIMNDFLQNFSSTPSVVIKGNALPKFVGRKSLVVTCSISGNTKETLLMTKEAVARGAEVICISSGGKLEDLAEKSGIKHLHVPNLGLPRASLPYLIMPCLALIKKSIDREMHFENLFKALESMRDKIILSVPEKDNPAKTISNFFSDGLAVCFTSPYLVSAGTRFKDSLNENAKVHCLRESILEASHNEIVPFTYSSHINPKVLLLTWLADSRLVKERLMKLRMLFQQISQPYIEVVSEENDIITAALTSIYLLDFSTIYMAIMRRVDPSPTPAIDILKSL